MTIIPQLERDLFKVAEQRLRPDATAPHKPSSSRPSSLRARLSFPVIVSVAVVVATAVVAVALLRHGRPAVQSMTPSGPRAVSLRADLIGTFGVLSRPQTKADLDRELLGLYLMNGGSRASGLPRGRYIPLSGPPTSLKRWGYPELDRPLVRVVSIPAWSAKALIAPTTFQPSPPSPKRSEGVNLALWIGTVPTIPPSSFTGTGPQPTSVATVRAHGVALADVARGNTVLDVVVLVPDGVTAVELGPFVSSPHRKPPRVRPTGLNAALAAMHGTATVRDNIAAFQFPMPVVTSARSVPNPVGGLRGFSLLGMGTDAQDTWLDARGHVLKRTTTNIDLIVRVQTARAG
jgi:hypothetical protein